MKTQPAKSGKPGISTALEVHLGAAGTLVGHLNYVSQGRREVSQFAYDETWLANPDRFGSASPPTCPSKLRLPAASRAQRRGLRVPLRTGRHSP